MDLYLAKVLLWLEETKALYPSVCDWIGIYYKESYIHKKDSTDLVLGPFLGEETEHVRISIDRGFCGMALREERTVNVADVTKDSTHIACSIKTRSELVIPISDGKGNFIAELDIDCNKLNAFTKEIEAIFEERVKSFPLLESYVPLPDIKFEGERVILRKMKPEDIHSIFEYAKNPNVTKYITWYAHESLNDSKKFIDYALSSYEKGVLEPLALILKSDPDKVIGSVGLMAASPRNRILELAYAMGEDYWGNGYVYEASKLLIEYAFKHYAVERIQCRCEPLNAGSERIMQKLGMTFEGINYASMYNKGVAKDLKMYALLRRDFRGWN
jgi:RimJ/RimL family protein N-acetyltransferase/putative methionine-R-sulfoxide reductase with GAF domain